VCAVSSQVDSRKDEVDRIMGLELGVYTTRVDVIGMGLSISRSIIEAHGGRLWATANVPHGAVFQFSLPVEQAAS